MIVTLTAGAAWSAGDATITLRSQVPSALGTVVWGSASVNVLDATTGQQVGMASTLFGRTLTLAAPASVSSYGAADVLQLSLATAPGTSVTASWDQNQLAQALSGGIDGLVQE